MNPNDPNVTLIEIVAERLGDDLRESMVFVGGAVAGLLITDEDKKCRKLSYRNCKAPTEHFAA